MFSLFLFVEEKKIKKTASLKTSLNLSDKVFNNEVC